MRIGTSVGLQLAGPQTIDDVVAEVRQRRRARAHGRLVVADLRVGRPHRHRRRRPRRARTSRSAPPWCPPTPATRWRSPPRPSAPSAVVGDRLTLGVGPSHAPIIEAALGMPLDRPARHTREYLEALAPLLRGEAVDVRGEACGRPARSWCPESSPPPAAALGPRPRHAAHRRRAHRRHRRHLDRPPHPRVTHRAPPHEPPPNWPGRPAPRVVLSVCIAVTADPDGARAWSPSGSAPPTTCPATGRCSTARASARPPTSWSRATRPPSSAGSGASPTWGSPRLIAAPVGDAGAGRSHPHGARRAGDRRRRRPLAAVPA